MFHFNNLPKATVWREVGNEIDVIVTEEEDLGLKLITEPLNMFF